MARKKILSVALATVLSVTTVFGSSPQLYQTVSVSAKETSDDSVKDTGETEVVSDAEQVNAGNYGLCDKTKDGAILHAWCWSFNTIKENLKDIAEAGFTTVQTSPANQCLKGENGGMSIWSENGQGKWEYHYQPTDWKIGNYQLGTRDEFIEMCEEADKYGVKIIVDVLPNHTTPDLGSVSKSLIEAAGGQDKLYHAEGFNSISRWEERFYCTNGAVLGLPDVNTENPGFQKYYLNYLNDLIDCGVDGFRYDTAKHIGLPDDPQDEKTKQNGWKNNFWPVALGNESVDGVSLHNKDQMFIYGEVLQSSGSRDGDYGRIFHLTGSGYGGALRGAIKNKNFGTGNISDWRHATPDKIVTWVESHDTYCNSHESGFLTDWDIRMCWAIIAARATGTPLFYSRPDGSNGSQGNYWGKNKIGAKGNDQFKSPEVVACNHFRNAMVGESEYMSNPNGNNNVLVIERGTKGAVIINLGSDLANVKLNKVSDGTYTEEVSGKQVQVSGGTLNYTVPGGTVAVVYNPTAITKNPSVSASKASGSFTEPFELKLTPSNATKATYSINGGDAVEFTKATTVKIGEGAEIGDKITVKVTAEGEGDPFSETYTYTMAEEPEVPEYKLYVRTKKSDYSSAPMAYVYTGDGTSAKKLNGDWPGAAMKEEGDYYVYATNDAESARIIFSYDGGQDPASEQPGYEVSGYAEYDKNSKKITKFTPPTQKPKETKTPTKTTAPTKEPTKEPEKTKTPTKEPTKEPVKTTAPTKEPTKEPEKTKAPTKEPTKTTAPAKDDNIQFSKEDGSSFNTETMDVKITLSGATKGSYSIDNGPEKSFVNSVTAKVGQGKIADSDVTLEVKTKVDGEEVSKKVTYRKVFDENTANVKASAIVKIKSAMEIVEDVAQTNAGSPTASYYSTNPNGQTGAKKTITSAKDFTEDMIIAQGVANDNVAIFRGSHEGPVYDSYALFGAYDDSNIYLGLQYTNVVDVTDPAQNYPQSDNGDPGNGDIPQMMVFDTGSGDYTDGTANDKTQKTAWDTNVMFSGDAKVDRVFVYSSKPEVKNTALFPVTNGIVDYTKVKSSKEGTDSGITYKYEKGFFCKNMYGVKGNGYSGYTPADLNSDSSNWVDFLSEGHSTTHDNMMIMTIPMSALGVDANQVANDGIGVMSISTFGASGIGSCPMDMSMVDVACDPYSADDSTSAEKEDVDTVTTALARLGGKADGGNNRPTKTKAPTKTEVTVKTEEPKKTEVPEKTKAPVKTETPEKTKAPVKTDAPKATEEPNTVTGFTVNFGADRSAPQYNTTELTLKAIAKGVSGQCTYEFAVDDEVVQEASEEDSYVWKGTPGFHTIKVTVEDSEGNKRISEKDYVIMAATNIDSSNTDTTPQPTKNVPNSDSNTAQGKLEIGVKASHGQSDRVKAGTSVKFTLEGKGGTAPYKYTIKIEGGSYGTKPYMLLDNSSNTTVQWTPLKKGTYKFYFIVQDASGDKVQKFVRYEISSCVSIAKLKASKTVVKKNKPVKFSMAATSDLSSASNMVYQLRAKRSGTAKSTIIKKYSKSRVYTWRAKKKGKYKITMTAKDTKGNTASKSIKITVK